MSYSMPSRKSKIPLFPNAESGLPVAASREIRRPSAAPRRIRLTSPPNPLKGEFRRTSSDVESSPLRGLGGDVGEVRELGGDFGPDQYATPRFTPPEAMTFGLKV